MADRSVNRRPATATHVSFRKSRMNDFSQRSVTPDKLGGGEIEIEMMNPDEEKHEISVQLQLIRKMHDQAKQEARQKRAQVEKLRQEIAQVDFDNAKQEEQATVSQTKLANFYEALEIAKQKMEFESMNKASYEHMLVRMKKDQLALEVQRHVLTKQLSKTNIKLNQETNKVRKAHEQRYQSKVVLSELRKNLLIEKRRRDERIVELEKNVRHRQEAASRREDRQRRQAEMAEHATTEDKDSQEVKMREMLCVQKFWYKILKKRLEEEQKRSTGLESAFNRIKISTGIRDVEDVVERFLTREQTYASLCDQVSTAERNLEALKNQHSTAKSQLKNMKMLTDGSRRDAYIEADRHDETLRTLNKENASVKETLVKTISTYDQLVEWGQKMLHQLRGLKQEDNLDVPTGANIGKGRETLATLFDRIAEYVSQKLKPILRQKEQAKREITEHIAKDIDTVLAEISSPDFTDKNVRVRPSSSTNLAGTDELNEEDLASMAESRMELREERQLAKQEAKEREDHGRRKKRRMLMLLRKG